jgi:hypothetical protein
MTVYLIQIIRKMIMIMMMIYTLGLFYWRCWVQMSERM